MGDLPKPTQWQPRAESMIHQRFKSLNKNAFTWIVLVSSFVALSYLPAFWISHTSPTTPNPIPTDAPQILLRCAELDVKPHVPAEFQQRTKSDRFVDGTPPTLIHNATIWTGNDKGSEVIRGDIFLDGGIIKWVGGPPLADTRQSYGSHLVIINAKGAWVTPGIVDLHSHLGVYSAPTLSGAFDVNSHRGITQPKLRSLDSLNTHDDAFILSISGGITSALVLPGSANAIGGQAFPIKLRPTSERSPSSKILEQPGSSTSTGWRQMKHACGENPGRRYKGTRMDTIWSFRAAYDKARKLVNQQDRFCAAAKAGKWDDLKGQNFPDDLEWEALADVIRGKVKVHTHCYEAVDLDGIVRLSNEFKFPIAAFHHAHEAYLVPELIKKTWGETPAIAMFAIYGRYKREAYRGSEFASRILADSGLRVVIKSDHPVMNSRYLLFDAHQAYNYGLDANTTLSSITTTPATVMGLGHRIGFIKPGYDADVVIWDSHPLALGATPKQVFIDGIRQFNDPYIVEKPATSQKPPDRPNFDKEIADTIKYEGLPSLNPSKNSQNVVFENVTRVWVRSGSGIGIEESFSTHTGDGVVIVENGQIKCTGLCQTEMNSTRGYEKVNLKGGSLAPGLLAFGSPLGINVIDGEPSTKDGAIFDPLTGPIPSILGGDGAVIKAVDGLQFETRDALLAYRSGITTAVSAPVGSGVFAGLGTHFSTGASNKLDKGALVHETTALHLNIGYTSDASPSVSSQIATLRRLLYGHGEGEQKKNFKAVTDGNIPLVIRVESADIMATLLQLKKEVEKAACTSLNMTFVGGSEAHLVAKQLGEAGVGVILLPVRPFPATWERRRILPGPPITKQSAVAALIASNVSVGLGVVEVWEARNSRFDASWVALETGISVEEALSMVSTNLEKLLGAEIPPAEADMVVYEGGSVFDSGSKVIAVISPRRHLVDFL